MTTIWQDNAANFATRPETYVDQERHVAVRRATALILDGQPGKALYVLTRSVERQHRILGGGTVPVEPTCACGGRCAHGTVIDIGGRV